MANKLANRTVRWVLARSVTATRPPRPPDLVKHARQFGDLSDFQVKRRSDLVHESQACQEPLRPACAGR
jgi:hypothetical protein